jgi:hypothetical protein
VATEYLGAFPRKAAAMHAPTYLRLRARGEAADAKAFEPLLPSV